MLSNCRFLGGGGLQLRRSAPTYVKRPNGESMRALYDGIFDKEYNNNVLSLGNIIHG